MVHDTHGFYSKIINEIGNVSVFATKITPKNAHLITLSDKKSGTMLFKSECTEKSSKIGKSWP